MINVESETSMPGTISLGIEHNFETAHRLPFLGGKCMNLHGHSWKVKIHFVAYHHAMGMNDHGISIDYGLVKKVVREWIDDKLDHGCMLGVKDPLLPVLLDEDSKVFVFGDPGFLEIAAEEEHRSTYNTPAEDRNYKAMPWPTVEATARMIAEELQRQVDMVFNDILWIDSVLVAETAVNSALWIPSVQNDGRFARFDERMYATETSAVTSTGGV